MMIIISPKTEELFCDCCKNRIAFIERKLFFKKYIFTRFREDEFFEYIRNNKHSGKEKIVVCKWCNEQLFDTIKKMEKDRK